MQIDYNFYYPRLNLIEIITKFWVCIEFFYYFVCFFVNSFKYYLVTLWYIVAGQLFQLTKLNWTRRWICAVVEVFLDRLNNLQNRNNVVYLYKICIIHIHLNIHIYTFWHIEKSTEHTLSETEHITNFLITINY